MSLILWLAEGSSGNPKWAIARWVYNEIAESRRETPELVTTFDQLFGREDESLDGGTLKAIASGTVLPTKVRIHVCTRLEQEELLLGAVDVNLDDPGHICLSPDEDSFYSGWFPLTTAVDGAVGAKARRSGQGMEIGGKIRLTFQWKHPISAGHGRPWQLDARIFEAADLPKTAVLTDLNTVGSNSPYVRFRVESVDENTLQRKVVERQTSTVLRGGSQPKWGVGCGIAEKWDQVMGESVQFKMVDAPPVLGIELWNADSSGDRIIGLHMLEVGSNTMAIKDPTKRWDSGAIWCDLQNPRTGASAGQVRVSVCWSAEAEQKEKDGESLRVARAAQVVHLLQDHYAHGGSYMTRTVLYKPGDAESLLFEADRRFRRHIVLYRQVLAMEPQQELADEEVRKRVAYEMTERWVKIVRDVEEASGSSETESLWQKWIGSVQTTEVVRNQPPAPNICDDVLLVALKSDDDLSAFLAKGTKEPLWAVDVATQTGSRMSLGTEAAAIRLQAAMRGRQVRSESRQMRHHAMVLQSIARGRKARVMVGRRRRKKLAISAEDELEASQRAFAEQLRKANDMLAGMNKLVTDIHVVADENEDALRGTAGWAAFSTANQEAAEALMETHYKELDKCVLASEMEVLLSQYQSSDLCKEDVVANTVARINAAKREEARALEELKTRIASLVDQMDELVRTTEAMGKNAWRRRRDPMELLLRQSQQAIDQASASKLVPDGALAEARKQRERVFREEQVRIVAEDAMKLEGEKCLDAAFAQTMRFLFSPAKDGLTAAERKRQLEKTEAETKQRAGKTWRASVVRTVIACISIRMASDLV
eukprot:COSAG02_NODE_3257_length_7081_cov_3.996419_3_plen_823_part_00